MKRLLKYIRWDTNRLWKRARELPIVGQLTYWYWESKRLYQMRLEHMTPIDQPLVLISQIPRSGGTLLSQLFDGHPQCYTHPHELYIGYPKRRHWPDLDFDVSAEDWFEQLLEKGTVKRFWDGYQKYPRKLYHRGDNYPFLLLPNLQRELFIKQVTQTNITCQRDILNCYMTAYFNAWLDYQGIFDSNKKYVVAFGPLVEKTADELLRVYENNVTRFFKDYPDGKLLSIIRDPKTWSVSARLRLPRCYADLQTGIAFWKACANAMQTNKERYGDQVYLLRFESLLQDTEATMHALADYRGLTFHNRLLKPTFNMMDIRANSIDAVQTYGILHTPLERAKMLSQAEVDYIEAETQEIYQAVLSAIFSEGIRK